MAIFNPPWAYIPDPTRGKPLFLGKLYFGVADQDPILFPKDVNLIQEDGSIIVAEQPIRTNAGGVPEYNGSPVAIDLTGDYSIAIHDRNDTQVYYFANLTEVTNIIETSLRAAALILNLDATLIGTKLITNQPGQPLDEAIYLQDTVTGFIYSIPFGIPPGSVVVSSDGASLVTSNGSFTMTHIWTESVPRNNTWNGYLDPEHQSSLPAPNGYPGNSGGGEVAYIADDEISFGIFAGASGSTVSSDSDGWIFTNSIYRIYDYTTAQLADIDVNAVPVYLKGQDGSEYFVNNSTTGINITKPDANTLKVEITDAIFATLGITKLWRWFDTERAGRVVELSAVELVNKIYPKLLNARSLTDVTASRALDVTYTNTSATEIDVYISATSPTSFTFLFGLIGSDTIIGTSAAGSNKASMYMRVPAGQDYKCSPQTGTFTALEWKEMRLT